MCTPTRSQFGFPGISSTLSASSKSRASLGSMVMIKLSLRSRRSCRSLSVTARVKASASAWTSGGNSETRPCPRMMERMSTPGSPACPSNSCNSPHSGRPGSMRSSSRTTPLKPAFGLLSPKPVIRTGPSIRASSGISDQPLPRCRSVPTQKGLPRSMTSRISPSYKSSPLGPPGLRVGSTRAITRSPWRATKLAFAGINSSSSLSVSPSGSTARKPNP